jgi:hypothetical protein
MYSSPTGEIGRSFTRSNIAEGLGECGRLKTWVCFSGSHGEDLLTGNTRHLVRIIVHYGDLMYLSQGRTLPAF